MLRVISDSMVCNTCYAIRNRKCIIHVYTLSQFLHEILLCDHVTVCATRRDKIWRDVTCTWLKHYHLTRSCCFIILFSANNYRTTLFEYKAPTRTGLSPVNEFFVFITMTFLCKHFDTIKMRLEFALIARNLDIYKIALDIQVDNLLHA